MSDQGRVTLVSLLRKRTVLHKKWKGNSGISIERAGG